MQRTFWKRGVMCPGGHTVVFYKWCAIILEELYLSTELPSKCMHRMDLNEDLDRPCSDRPWWRATCQWAVQQKRIPDRWLKQLSPYVGAEMTFRCMSMLTRLWDPERHTLLCYSPTIWKFKAKKEVDKKKEKGVKK